MRRASLYFACKRLVIASSMSGRQEAGRLTLQVFEDRALLCPRSGGRQAWALIRPKALPRVAKRQVGPLRPTGRAVSTGKPGSCQIAGASAIVLIPKPDKAAARAREGARAALNSATASGLPRGRPACGGPSRSTTRRAIAGAGSTHVTRQGES